VLGEPTADNKDTSLHINKIGKWVEACVYAGCWLVTNGENKSLFFTKKEAEACAKELCQKNRLWTYIAKKFNPHKNNYESQPKI